MSLRNLRFLLLASLFLLLLSPRASAALGFNLGGDTDILWHHNTLLDNFVWYMSGTNYVGLTGTFPKASNVNWQVVATKDFDRDGTTDLLWRDGTTGQNAIWLPSITGAIRVYQMITDGDVNFDVVGAGDFNGDGYADILWRHKTLDLTVAWFMNGTNFSGSIGWIPPMPDTNWGPVAVADCNNDGNADILWRNQTTGENMIWFMDGTNKTSSAAIASMGVTNKLAGTGQFNRIGNTDILWRNTTTNGLNSMWSMSGTNYLYTTVLPPVTDTNFVIAGTGGYGIPMLLSATPSVSPTSLTIIWRYGSLYGDPDRATIYRKTPTATTWTNLASNYLPLRFTNTDVVVGQRYEYSVMVDGTTNYLLTGINVPAVEKRGRVLLLVDNTLTNDADVRRQLANLKTNLVGDGWSVTRHDVARHNDGNYNSNTSNIASNKSLILSFYKSEPAAANFVFIIGHVAIPYSGNANSDGHPDHFGAWPTDGYYGNTNAISVNGNPRVSWTDSTVNNTNPGYPENVNVPGDGKFDNDFFPTNQAGLSMEMPVGRVDFAKLPAFYNPANGAPRKTEAQLLAQYLQKNHKYRNKQTILTERTVGAGYFQIPLQPRDSRDEQICTSIVRNGTRLFGVNAGRIFEGDFFKETTSFVLGLQAAAGSYHSMAARDGFGNYVFHVSEDLALAVNEPKGGFYMLHASYLADWNLSTNNLVRALLATANYGLAAMCNSFPNDNPWYYEPLGLGEPIGVGALRTINAASPFASRWMALMGDPTLRAQITSPASNLSGNNGTNITLTWAASPESDVQYYVYRSVNDLDGPWTNLGATSATSFINNPAPPGPKMYQVRAAKLITTGSGSFTNLSQGIFVNLN